MNIAILGDLHLGARDGKQIFHDNFEAFFTNTFFPYIDDNNINTIIQLGDTFDRRKFIDYSTLKRSKEYLFEPLRQRNIQVYMIIGNHDISLRNSLEINSPSLVLNEYDNIHPIVNPTELLDYNISLYPWICKENYAECIEHIENTKSEICMGHFEIEGFKMNAGMLAKEGINENTFRKFDAVYSGHFHHRSSHNNIHYVGTPYELTFSDIDNQKGFHILNTQTRDIQFISNPNKLFKRITYEDNEIDVSDCKGKYVKVIVKEKNDYYMFDRFLERLYTCGAYDIKIVEDILDFSPDEIDEKIEVDDTITILDHYVKNSEIDIDKNKLSSFIKELYLEALDTAI